MSDDDLADAPARVKESAQWLQAHAALRFPRQPEEG
jgi:hypothetical protein